MGRKLGRWFLFSPTIVLVAAIIVAAIYGISLLTGYNPLVGLMQHGEAVMFRMNIIISVTFPLFVIGIILLATTPGKNAPVFTVKGAIHEGRLLSKSHIGTFFLSFLLLIALQSIVGIAYMFMKQVTGIAFITSFFTLRIFLGYQNIALLIAKQLPVKFSNIFVSFKKVFFFVIANILRFFIVSFGLVLFVVPGIRRGLRLSMISYCILEKSMNPLAAIKASWNMTKGFVADLYLFSLMGSLILFLGAIALGIGLIRAIPIYVVAQAYIYTRISLKYFSENITAIQKENITSIQKENVTIS